MAVQPNASAFYTPDGKIWLASVPASGSGGTLRTCARPFLDLEGQVLVLTSLAFHPDFATNRRFFVSYICDTIASPTCGSSAETGNKGSSPSQYRLVVAEFSDKAKGTRADPSEVRKLFTMDLPQTHTFNQQQAGGGQIMFGPSDGYLYLVTGHGGEQANRESSNDTSSLLGNIIRFNVDKGVTGQSAVGTSNPTANRSATVAATTDMGELDVFAVGLANPRGCSFDSEMPDYLYCANVDETAVPDQDIRRQEDAMGAASPAATATTAQPSKSTDPAVEKDSD
ncbi:hypothetical protein HU200_003317 [Digitaria exilis]|uniref:Glucose/Sorbosone dehydrogenase domain-containing protein n=1 Tax=Digitaria exilis TaxID=1010633 RepID=A0A835FU88_9POAL|nr:hypothetical protein HU200_003317 [Digitaria exilis]